MTYILVIFLMYGNKLDKVCASQPLLAALQMGILGVIGQVGLITLLQ